MMTKDSSFFTWKWKMVSVLRRRHFIKISHKNYKSKMVGNSPVCFNLWRWEMNRRREKHVRTEKHQKVLWRRDCTENIDLTIFDGEIIFDGKDVTNVPMEKRGFNIIFQDYALFPNLNVMQNITYSLKNTPNISTQEEVIELLGLKPHLNKKIDQLSGAQKQMEIYGKQAFPPVLFPREEMCRHWRMPFLRYFLSWDRKKQKPFGRNTKGCLTRWWWRMREKYWSQKGCGIFIRHRQKTL